MRTNDVEPPWPELRAMALQQRGLITRAGIEAAGVHYRVIARRVADGRLCERHPGVFTFGHGPLTQEARMLAALAWCGEHACLSHLSAAAVFGWVPFPTWST